MACVLSFISKVNYCFGCCCWSYCWVLYLFHIVTSLSFTMRKGETESKTEKKSASVAIKATTSKNLKKAKTK